MANSKLKNKEYKIPDKLLQYLLSILQNNTNMNQSRGYKRLNFILQKKTCSYEQLKRIKNYFDHIDPNNFDKVEYNLNGGERMQKWVNRALQLSREQVKGTKAAKHNAGMDNSFRKPSKDNPISDAMPTNIRVQPDLMTNNALVEQINRIKTIINKF